MEKHRFLFAVAAVLVVLGLFAVPTAEACCTPCQNWCTKTTPPETVCCTGIPVPGDACGHTTCGKYLCGKRCAILDEAPAETAMTPLQPAAPAGCSDDAAPLFTAPEEAAPQPAVAAD
jgi:hypothetical protein